MKNRTKTSYTTVLATSLLATSLLAAVSAIPAYAANPGNDKESTAKLLSAHFEPRKVVKIEAGDFHFLPGQIAPIHTHDAPAIGYVAKGRILYQVDGEKPQLLQEGDAFYEPVGPRILRFDNASATEEAVFIDFNLQQKGEPFIVFEKELTENIDRRTLPTTELADATLERVNVFSTDFEPSGSKLFKESNSTLGYVAEGTVRLINSDVSQSFIAGEIFSLMGRQGNSVLNNQSESLPAKVITFDLH